MSIKEEHKQKVQAVGDRVVGLREELRKALRGSLVKEKLKANPRDPNDIVIDWIISEFAVVIYTQEQLINNWNNLMKGGDTPQ